MAEMTTQDIVKNSDEVRDHNLDWETTYASLVLAVKSNEYRVLRTNNTLFLIHIDSPGVAQVYTFNADSKHRFLGNMKEFLKAMKVAKYHTVYGVTNNEQMLRVMERAGFNGKIEQVGTQDGKPAFKGTMRV
jgi:hypothetical protein